MCGRLLAQAPGAAPALPEATIEQIKKSVVFIVGQYVENGSLKESAGTGFLIFVPEARLGPDRGYVWLVTSKHVLREPRPDGGEGPFFKQVLVRFNTKEPLAPDGRQFALNPLNVLDDKGDLAWFTDPNDDTVDLGLVSVWVDETKVDAVWIPTSMFVTKELIKTYAVSENDEILFAGLFNWYAGSMKNYPIVRHGKLALLPNERIPLNRERPELTADLYLAEITSFGGNSGSPVFLRLGGMREAAGQQHLEPYSYFLLGVMQGFFPEASPVAVEARQVHRIAAQNSGIAGVVPADKILHILQSPRAKAKMDELVRKQLILLKK